MIEPSNRPSHLGVFVPADFPVYYLHRLIVTHGPDMLAKVQRSIDAGNLPPEYLTRTHELLADINDAAAFWLRSQGPRTAGTASGPIPTDAAVMASPLTEITTEQAADLLNVLPRQIRKLIKAGHLDGRKVGSAWLVTTVSVTRYRRQM